MTQCLSYLQVDAEGVQNPLTVLPTRLGLSVRAIDGPAAASGGYSQLSTGSAPFQSAMGGEAFQVSLTISFFFRSVAVPPDPILLPWSWIRNPDLDPIRPNSVFGSGSGPRRAKITHKNRKSEEISCIEVLDVLL
jgi:hypothetical protein